MLPFLSSIPSRFSAVLQEQGPFNHRNILVSRFGEDDNPEQKYYFAYMRGIDREKQLRYMTQISPWHHIPLRALPSIATPEQPQSEDIFYNFILEIPQGETKKNEIFTHQPLNPIGPDVRNGSIRFLQHGPIPFNYGCFPQTFEDPNINQLDTGLPGDGDPLDVIDISDSEPSTVGCVYPVKVLGTLGLIDQDECDFKIIACRANDTTFDDPSNPEFKKRVDIIREWFQYYKIAEGKSENKWCYSGSLQTIDFTHGLLGESYRQWSSIAEKQIPSDFVHSEDDIWLPKYPIPKQIEIMAGYPIDKSNI